MEVLWTFSQGIRTMSPQPIFPPFLGLQNIHLLTLKQKYQLRVELDDFENNTAFAKYADFSLSPNAISAEEDGYTLHVSGFTDGGAGKRPPIPSPISVQNRVRLSLKTKIGKPIYSVIVVTHLQLSVFKRWKAWSCLKLGNQAFK